jgi:hypothetical protein
MPDPGPIFGELYGQWPDMYSDATVAAEDFERPLMVCDIAACRGMCCYDGVYVEAEVREALEELVAERGNELVALGASADGPWFVEGEFQGRVLGIKTATRAFDFRSIVRGFPSHFNQTICAFNDGQGYCTLQTLAMKDGRHPWDYKPPACWMHPLELNPMQIALCNEENDPNIFPEYPGYASRTMCGRTNCCGAPARITLREEICYLERLIARKLPLDTTDGE